MLRRLDHEVAPRPVHPIQHQQVRAALDAGERRREPRIDRDRAHRVGFAGILRAVFAPHPWRGDAADEIEPGIERLRQRDTDLAGTHAVRIISHVLPSSGAYGGCLVEMPSMLLLNKLRKRPFLMPREQI